MKTSCIESERKKKNENEETTTSKTPTPHLKNLVRVEKKGKKKVCCKSYKKSPTLQSLTQNSLPTLVQDLQLQTLR